MPTASSLTLSYPAQITEPEPGQYLVVFPTVPEAVTGGSSFEEARLQAADALVVALEGIVLEGRPLPAPSDPSADELGVAVPIADAARLVLMQVATTRGLSNRALADVLGRDEKQVRRIMSGKSASLESTLDALGALGVVPALSFYDVPAAA